MKYRVIAILGAVSLLPATVLAQEVPPTQEEMSVSVNWGNLQTAVMALVQANRKSTAETVALRKHVADMDAYLKACGDKPGCSVPVKE